MISRKEDLVTLASDSKKLPNFIWGTILVLIFMFAGQIVGGICVVPLYFILNNFDYFLYNQNFLELFLSLMSCIFVSALVFIRVKFREKRSISTLGFSKDNWFKKYAKGFLIGIIMMTVVVLILFALGCIEVEKNPSQPVGIASLSGVLIILAGWIMQGSSEEIVTRGWFMNVIGARYNITFGLILSSVIFGLLHLLNPQVNLLAVINIILVGFFYGLYVIKTNDLWAVCGMHTAWNFAQGNIFGFEVSGINVQVCSIFDLNLVGNDVISGGVFGPEAGLISTFVLLVGIVIVLMLDKKSYFNDKSGFKSVISKV